MYKLVLLSGLLAGCGSGGGFFDAAVREDAVPPGGTFSAQWMVTDTGGAPIECTKIGGQFVTVLMRNRALPIGEAEVFGCASLSGQSKVVPAGIYDIRFELSGIAGVLAMAPEQMAVEIKSQENTVLAPLTFAVDAQGGLALRLDAGKAGGNCGATPAGAGITATTITLEHADTTCAPVTFAISAGANQPAGSYTVNCQTPAIGPCIESDQELTVSGIPSDSYRIHVRGRIGANNCYLNDDSFQVPTNGAVLTRTLNLAHQMLPDC
jgi:hypothetical protein